ncbi:allantoicase [Pseudonocardia sp. C8]|uniref:allantoicase n=1 Tax=Pseudonocardia sp. C8 TaxID=2762759 RepID=UPI00164282AA|nr:allantoicase [Pseudonocardia sp. C8]
MTDFTDLVDMASRKIGGRVVSTNDEFFVEKENLIKPEAPVSCKGISGNRGGVYDGWETRRRRQPGHDWVIVRLGAPGVIDGVVVDTAFFRGNYPDRISIDAYGFEDGVSDEEVNDPAVDWVRIVPETSCQGDTENQFGVTDDRRYTHVRLNIHPDGGVARLRVYGHVIPDPRHLDRISSDLAAVENGAVVVDASDKFFNPADNVIMPGTARTTKDGWETKRRRDDGHDWLVVQLAAPGHIRQAIVDTSRYIGNAPDRCSLQGCDATRDDVDDPTAWWELLPATAVQPDTIHRIPVRGPDRQVTHVRLNILPDGGLARLRLVGYATDTGRAHLGTRWFDHLPEHQATRVLTDLGLTEGHAGTLVAARPSGDTGAVLSALDEMAPELDDALVTAIRELLLGPRT